MISFMVESSFRVLGTGEPGCFSGGENPYPPLPYTVGELAIGCIILKI